MRFSSICKIAALMAAAFASIPASALDADAGDYTALPAGTNLALLYYQHATRDELYANGSKVPGSNRLDSDVGILRGVHFMDIGGTIVDPQFLLPFGTLKAKDNLSALGDTSGVGDLILGATVWLLNNPKANTYVGVTPWVYAPTGSYDKNRALNLGENRWKYALQLGFITGLTDKLLLDLIGDVTWYGKNDDFGPTSATMKQRAMYEFQAYLRYQLTPTWDVRMGALHYSGGETEVNGVMQNDRTRTTKFTVGTAFFVTPKIQLMANYGQDGSVHNGLRENNRLNLRFLSVF
ncbi:MAG: transporter [Rhodocyclaceae bacterium]|nr:transporter [Rhodocyclaceae bacterium]MBX3668337.1 transporter [Rhodocyclaceae bacterium]